MPDNDSSVGNVAVVNREGGSFLVVHFLQGSQCHLGVVFGVAIAEGYVCIHIFEIRQIDVDIRGKHLQCLQGVVAASVVDGGGVEAPVVKAVDDGGDMVGIMRGCDKTHDVFGGIQHLDDAVNNFIDTFKSDVGIYTIRTDCVVLTIDTLEVAMSEKHIADTLLSAEGWLFAFMNADSCHLGLGGATAESKSVYSVSEAASRA